MNASFHGNTLTIDGLSFDHPKVIKTTMEHERALARIEQLFTANPSTPEGDDAAFA